MAIFSKINKQDDSLVELDQNKVDMIAYMLLVEKQSMQYIEDEMQIPITILESIVEARTHKNKWLNAIARWGRLNLIEM